MPTIYPDEKPVAIRTPQGIGLLAAVLATLVLINALAIVLLRYQQPNRGYWLIREKWRLLDHPPPGVTRLILGDSSGNQGIIPEQLDLLLGGRTINLCTMGNAGVIHDAWMLQTFVSRHPAPREVVLVHAYDVWKRRAFADCIVQIPGGERRLGKFSPAAPSSMKEKLKRFASRYVPLYSQEASIKIAVQRIFKKRIPSTLTSSGYMPVYKANPDRVLRDTKKHLRRLSSDRPKLSKETREALLYIYELSNQHTISVHIVSAPVADTLYRSDIFREYLDDLDRQLVETIGTHQNVKLHKDRKIVSASEMDNTDHVIHTSAIDFTTHVANQVGPRKAMPVHRGSY